MSSLPPAENTMLPTLRPLTKTTKTAFYRHATRHGLKLLGGGYLPVDLVAQNYDRRYRTDEALQQHLNQIPACPVRVARPLIYRTTASGEVKRLRLTPEMRVYRYRMLWFVYEHTPREHDDDIHMTIGYA